MASSYVSDVSVDLGGRLRLGGKQTLLGQVVFGQDTGEGRQDGVPLVDVDAAVRGSRDTAEGDGGEVADGSVITS